MDTKTQFTPRQLEAWRNFEFIRQSGVTNMLSAQVQELCDISREEHMFILENYAELKEAATA